MHLPAAASTMALAALVACTGSRAAESQAPAGPPPVAVEIGEVRAHQLRDTGDYVATLRSRRSVEVRGQVEGYVTRIAVRSGSVVRRGEVLMRIDQRRQRAATRGQEALLDARRANAAYWHREHDRMKRLRAGGAVAQQELDQAANSRRSADAELAAQEAQAHAEVVQLEFYDVEAPWDGVVGDIPVRLGDLASPQTLLTTIDDNTTLETYVEVPAGRAARLGTPVELSDESGKLLAHTALAFVSPRASADTQTVLVKAPVDNRDGALRAGQIVRARVVWATREGPAVPVLSVQNQNGQPFAWVVERSDGGAFIAQPRAVKVGPIQGQLYPVESGLRVGERVVFSGVQKLHPGAAVTPASSQPDGAAGG